MRDLARHPSTARFVATKLVEHFVADEPAGERQRHPVWRERRLAQPRHRRARRGPRRPALALGPAVPLLLKRPVPVDTWADSPLPAADEDLSSVSPTPIAATCCSPACCLAPGAACRPLWADQWAAKRSAAGSSRPRRKRLLALECYSASQIDPAEFSRINILAC